jgi:hypothetical protein
MLQTTGHALFVRHVDHEGKNGLHLVVSIADGGQVPPAAPDLAEGRGGWREDAVFGLAFKGAT